MGVLLTSIVALALGRWANGWPLVQRTLLATAASILPVLGATAFVLATLDNVASMILSLDPEEFLIPLGLQIFANIILAAPVSWWISRRRHYRQDPATPFE